MAGLKRKLTKRLAAHQVDLRPEWEVSVGHSAQRTHMQMQSRRRLERPLRVTRCCAVRPLTCSGLVSVRWSDL